MGAYVTGGALLSARPHLITNSLGSCSAAWTGSIIDWVEIPVFSYTGEARHEDRFPGKG